MDLRHLRMPAAQSSTPPDRRLIAVGTTRHLDGRTITVRATEAGVTGTIHRRCPACHRTFEDCTCTGARPAAPTVQTAPTAQTFDDDSDDACPRCGDWTCTCRTPATRQTRHALTALAALTPGRRRVVQATAEEYLSQIEHRSLPIGWNRPITGDRYNRVDAYRHRRGHIFARMLGIACQPQDPHLPDTARAVLAAIDAPVAELVARAQTTGHPGLVALLHILGATDFDPDIGEALRRVRAPRPAVTA